MGQHMSSSPLKKRYPESVLTEEPVLKKKKEIPKDPLEELSFDELMEKFQHVADAIEKVDKFIDELLLMGFKVSPSLFVDLVNKSNIMIEDKKLYLRISNHFSYEWSFHPMIPTPLPRDLTLYFDDGRKYSTANSSSSLTKTTSGLVLPKPSEQPLNSTDRLVKEFESSEKVFPMSNNLRRSQFIEKS